MIEEIRFNMADQMIINNIVEFVKWTRKNKTKPPQSDLELTKFAEKYVTEHYYLKEREK